MKKADLIEEVSRVGEMTRKDSEVIVETILECIVKALRAADKMEIRGFGSFRIRQRDSRVGRNPKTGARVEVPSKKVPYFKPSKELKDLINGARTEMEPAEKVKPPPNLKPILRSSSRNSSIPANGLPLEPLARCVRDSGSPRESKVMNSN